MTELTMFTNAGFPGGSYPSRSSKTNANDSHQRGFCNDDRQWMTIARSQFVASGSANQWQTGSVQLWMGMLGWLSLMGVALVVLPRSPASSSIAAPSSVGSERPTPSATESPAQSPAQSSAALSFDLLHPSESPSDRAEPAELTDEGNPFVWSDSPSDRAELAELTDEGNPFVWSDSPVNDGGPDWAGTPDVALSAESCSRCVRSSGLVAWLNNELSDPLFIGDTHSLVARAIGAAEGTRTIQGDRTPAYYGHRDPGNGVWNLGTFSYQHGATSPEAADRKQLERLYQQAQQLRSLAAAHNIPLTNEIMMNGLDLANQAPRAALSEQGGYFQRLREAYDEGYFGAEAILEARTHSYIDPMTNRWDAPGLGNTHRSIRADQLRRQQAIDQVMRAFTAEYGQRYAPDSPAVALVDHHESMPSLTAIASAFSPSPSETSQLVAQAQRRPPANGLDHSNHPARSDRLDTVKASDPLDFGFQQLS